MARDSGTRSGLLWEVERLLNEVENLPQILLMENVDAVRNDRNIEHFQEWMRFLEDKGYCNYVQDMNGADYGVAQHRVRCFMISILGDYNYKFPVTIPLNKIMADYLEDEVDEKYYVKSEKALALIKELEESGKLEGISNTIRGGEEVR